MKTLTAHINCNPYIEDGKWHIDVEALGYLSCSAADNDSVFIALEDILDTALDNGSIHSYYIHRHDDPAPINY